MNRRVVVTGCNGFVGRHLTAYLHQSQIEVCGLGVEQEGWAPWLTYRKADIENIEILRDCVNEWQVDTVYHLAAIANPRMASQSPLTAVRVNVMGTCNLLEIARETTGLRLLVVGSSETYRTSDSQARGLDEDSPLEAHNIYGATKMAAETIGVRYAAEYRLQVCFTRSFNQVGPGQPPLYVLSDFAKQCAEIKKEVRDPLITVGNLRVSRDFTDVRDVVRAYKMLADGDMQADVYNVCSGNAYRIDELLDYLVSLTGRTDVRIEEEPARIRKNEAEIIRGSNGRLVAKTGWTPEIRIEQSLSDLFEYWMARI